MSRFREICAMQPGGSGRRQLSVFARRALLTGAVVLVVSVYSVHAGGAASTSGSKAATTVVVASSALDASDSKKPFRVSSTLQGKTESGIAVRGHLLFTRTQGNDVQTIFLATPSGVRRLTRPGSYCCLLRISPDHKKILVMPGGDIPPPVTGGTINLAGGGFKRLLTVDPKLNLVPHAWSPDGTRIAFEGWDDSEPSRTGVYTATAADGTGLLRVTTRPGPITTCRSTTPPTEPHWCSTARSASIPIPKSAARCGSLVSTDPGSTESLPRPRDRHPGRAGRRTAAASCSRTNEQHHRVRSGRSDQTARISRSSSPTGRDGSRSRRSGHRAAARSCSPSTPPTTSSPTPQTASTSSTATAAASN